MGSHRVLSIVEERSDSREAPRTRVFLTATLRTSAREYRVRLRDLSATGARVEAGELPPRDADVVIERGGFTGFGHMVWTDGSHGGLAFEEPLADDDLFATINALRIPNPDEAPEFKRPGFNREDQHAAWSDGRGWIDPSLAGR